MKNSIDDYNFLLNELYLFYNEIKNYILLHFEKKNDKELLEVNFYDNFVISNNLNSRFILYDKPSRKFLLSIPGGINAYNEKKNVKSLKLIDIKDKMENKYYSYFTNGEISQIINGYNIDFIKYIKSEFLYELVKRNINLEGRNIIHYSDDYIECSEKFGFVINNIIVELETRKLAKEFGFLYIPTSIGNDYILRKLYFICLEKQEIIFNSNIDELFGSLLYLSLKEIFEFEKREFEKKYNLKRNSLSDEEDYQLMYKSVKQKRYELINELAIIRDEYLKRLNGDGSFYDFEMIAD